MILFGAGNGVNSIARGAAPQPLCATFYAVDAEAEIERTAQKGGQPGDADPGHRRTDGALVEQHVIGHPYRDHEMRDGGEFAQQPDEIARQTHGGHRMTGTVRHLTFSATTLATRETT